MEFEESEKREVSESPNKGINNPKEALERLKILLENRVIKRDSLQFIFDFEEVLEYDPFFIDYFLENPSIIVDSLRSEIRERYGEEYSVFFKNLNVNENISDIRVEHLGKMVKVKGMLSNATPAMMLVKSRVFNCASCGTNITTEGKVPLRCSCGRKGGFYVVSTEYEDLQEIVLEENQDEIGDRSPKKTRVRLVDKLCVKEMNNIIKDGSKIEVIGIVQEIPLKKDAKLEEEIYQFRIFALQVNSLDTEFDETITEDDIMDIEEISMDKPLDRLSNSLCPNIIGNELIKKALILSMVSGTEKKLVDGKREKDKIHILLVGSAGLAKTEMLQAVARRHFKGRYASCERLSEVGIVGGVEKDEITGSWGLKCGLLPKQNKGLQILDELDKADRGVQKALHTPMESGVVSINKAGINALLSADCTVICGANPKNSRFDINKPIVEQINMEPTLLSRFDLIFVMTDSLGEKEDEEIAKSIFEDSKPEIELIDLSLFKKYIKHASKLKPKFNEEAKTEITKFYPEIRRLSKRMESGMEGMPIVPRQLKGIKRLSEASAKIRLSNTVEIQDAKFAIELFKYSLLKLGMDLENGLFDMARISGGKTVSKRQKMELILGELRTLIGSGGGVPNNDFKALVKNKFSIEADEFYNIMEMLHQENLVINSVQGWKLVNS
ncbi:MAG: minichromosome maintenance protein MCM [Clostridia bacterium]|nr:minichromosome maintenance protein MCM [Clostridia bacterium]